MALLTWSGAPSSSQDDRLSVSAYADRVETLRRFFRHHRAYAAWLIAAASFMKVVVPAGYMPVVSSGSIVFELCSGVGPEKMAIAMPGMVTHHGKADHSSKDDMPFGFGSCSRVDGGDGSDSAGPRDCVHCRAPVSDAGVLAHPSGQFPSPPTPRASHDRLIVRAVLRNARRREPGGMRASPLYRRALESEHHETPRRVASLPRLDSESFRLPSGDAPPHWRLVGLCLLQSRRNRDWG